MLTSRPKDEHDMGMGIEATAETSLAEYKSDNGQCPV
jgi:hypothetical protein